MKLRTFIAAVVLTSGTSLFAQEVNTPKFEFGLNYTFTRINAGGSIGSYSANGGSGYAEYNVNRYLGLVADLGGNTISSANSLSLNNTEFTYLFGPRLNWRTSSRITPYFQALVGGARFPTPPTPTCRCRFLAAVRITSPPRSAEASISASTIIGR